MKVASPNIILFFPSTLTWNIKRLSNSPMKPSNRANDTNFRWNAIYLKVLFVNYRIRHLLASDKTGQYCWSSNHMLSSDMVVKPQPGKRMGRSCCATQAAKKESPQLVDSNQAQHPLRWYYNQQSNLVVFAIGNFFRLRITVLILILYCLYNKW